MSDRGEKLIIGARLKRLRRTLGITQAQMAQELGVSPSYITLIEANQRPISAKLLLKLSQVYDFAPRDIAGEQDVQLQSELEAALKDPIFAAAVPRGEVADVVNASPTVARALLRLHERFRSMSIADSAPDNPMSSREKIEFLDQTARPVEEVRAHFHARHNHIPSLDWAAEELADRLDLHHAEAQIVLSERLRERHGFRVRILPQDVMPGQLRLLDPHRKQLNLSERLDQPGRRFQIAVQLAKLEYHHLISAETVTGNFSNASLPLARASYANYFAAALLMPYARFLQSAEAAHYDVELLGQRFGASYEQVAHRLTTLQRPEARGIPFFFVRVDRAGNVSKRFSGGRFHFSTFGGTCPLWNVHSCFETPGRVQTQVIGMPEGTTYFSIARTVTKYVGDFTEPAVRYAIGLGCDIAYAPRLIYARALNLPEVAPTPIGVNCYICERQACPSRAFPPINRPYLFSERERGVSSFDFQSP